MKLYLFVTNWCRPCEEFEPRFREYMRGTGIEHHVVDISTNLPEAKFRNYVKHIPTLIVMQDDKIKTAVVGNISNDQIFELISEYSE